VGVHFVHDACVHIKHASRYLPCPAGSAAGGTMLAILDPMLTALR
jgi:hypothetical protein